MKMPNRFTKVLLTILVAILLMAPTTGPGRNPNPQAGLDGTAATDVYVHPLDGEVDINLGDNLIFYFGWVACSKGLSIDLLRANQVIVAVRQAGSTIQRFGGPANRVFWSSPSIPVDSDPSWCFFPAVDEWIVWYENDQLVFDSAGTYRIALIWRVHEPIIDGSADVDGIPFYYDGEILDTTVKVNVLP